MTMNDLSQTMADTSVPPKGWFEFAKRHRALLASLFVLVFPLIMPFKALAASILIYGLYALGFNLLFGLGSVSLVTGENQSVAWEAHVGGFLAGLLLFSLFDPVKPAVIAGDPRDMN